MDIYPPSQWVPISSPLPCDCALVAPSDAQWRVANFLSFTPVTFIEINYLRGLIARQVARQIKLCTLMVHVASAYCYRHAINPISATVNFKNNNLLSCARDWDH